MNTDIEFETRDGVAWITLNRPAARNAFTQAMARRFAEIVQALQADRTTHVVLLRANGTDFSVGADLKEMSGGLPADPAQRAREVTELARATSIPIFTGLHALPQILVASLRGHAIGIGGQIPCCVDLCIASETAKILLPQARLAHPVDHGESYFLPRKVGMARAMQILLLAETVTAPQALQYDLVNWVVPDGELESRTAELVARLRAVAPIAAREIKGLLRQSATNGLNQQFEAEMQALGVCAATEDLPEALRAFVEKRAPVFRGR